MMNVRRIIFVLGFLSLCQQAFPQFIRGFGLFVGETSSRHRFKNKYPQDDTAFRHAYPPSQKATERHSWSVGIFLEMLRNDVWRWQTEIEYCNKGSRVNTLLNPITDEKEMRVNKLSYLQWNNFLKRFIYIGINKPTYLMIGVRAEYNLARSTPAYSYVTDNFKKLWVTPDVGLGMEFPLRGGWGIFVEEHYNPDAWYQYSSDGGKIWANSRTWETRVGVIYRMKQGIGAYDLDCNAPKYRGR